MANAQTDLEHNKSSATTIVSLAVLGT